MKSVQKLVSLLFLVVFFGLASQAHAAQLNGLKLTMDDTTPALGNVMHSFQFTHNSATTIRKVVFEYCTLSSGYNNACTKPTSLVTTAAVKGTVTGLTNAAWTLNSTVDGKPTLEHVGAGQAVNNTTVITVPIDTITNHNINECQPGGDASSDTCYVRVRTYTTVAGVYPNFTDEGIVSYTVVAAVTISARVDPTFSFVIESVDSNTVHNGITTSAASTFQTLPFGNLTAGTPKYVAHALRVTSNSKNGYSVTMEMVNQMTGNYSANNIDPYTALWTNPQAWAEPNGSTPNDNTGWIGANTTDTDVSGWSSGANLFGTVSGTANTVMSSNSSDNGSTPIYVTYAIEANVFQPADTYSGTIRYNALPTY